MSIKKQFNMGLLAICLIATLTAFSKKHHIVHGIQIIHKGKQVRLVLSSDHFFRPQGTTIIPSTIPDLKFISHMLLKNNNAVLNITGHTDNVRSERQQQITSYQQADNIAFFLWTQGIDFKNLRVSGKADRKNVSSNATVKGSADNRRVEIRY